MSPNSIRIAEGHPCPTCFDHTRLVLVNGTWLHVCATCKTVTCKGRVRQLVRIALAFVLWTCMSAPAFAAPITWDFSVSKESGNVIGSFTYDTQALPVLTGYGGMANFVYAPTEWSFDIHSTFLGDTTFASTLTGQRAEWCVGVCTWGNGGAQQVRLNVANADGSLAFHFFFDVTEPVSQLTTQGQVGGFGQAVYSSVDRGTSAFVTGGALETFPKVSVPEPETFWFLLAGLGVCIWSYCYWKEVTR